MVTHSVADSFIDCCGLILCSFPLHLAGKPGSNLAAHFDELSDTRDALADSALLSEQVGKLSGHAKLHWLDTA